MHSTSAIYHGNTTLMHSTSAICPGNSTQLMHSTTAICPGNSTQLMHSTTAICPGNTTQLMHSTTAICLTKDISRSLPQIKDEKLPQTKLENGSRKVGLVWLFDVAIPVVLSFPFQLGSSVGSFYLRNNPLNVSFWLRTTTVNGTEFGLWWSSWNIGAVPCLMQLSECHNHPMLLFAAMWHLALS